MLMGKNELHPELLGTAAMNPYAQSTAGSREQMFASSHLSQMLVLIKSEPRQSFSGMERKYGKHTFGVRMPADGKILAMIPRYPITANAEAIKVNPETLVIYEEEETKRIGCFMLTQFFTYHQYFGFRYKTFSGMQQLRIGANIAKDTLFLGSPNLDEDNNYNYGLNANVAFMSLPGVAEDGIVVSESFCKKLAFRTYEKRQIEWGSAEFALNLYGTVDAPKCFPDIGDWVRDDGLLMAKRSYEPTALTPTTMSAKAMMTPNVDFDNCVYVPVGGRVVDIKIHHESADRNMAEKSLDDQPQKYDNARRIYCQAIVDFCNNLGRGRDYKPTLSEELHSIMVHALAVVNDSATPRVSKQYRRTPLDVFRVEFVIEYEIIPNTGFKLTDCHGGKGVVCKRVPDEHMPVDENGNRADCVMSGDATINRANPGRLYEQFHNACARDLHVKLARMTGTRPFMPTAEALAIINTVPDNVFDDVWGKFLKYFEIISPRQRAWFENGVIEQTPRQYLAEIIHLGIGNFIPTDNDPPLVDMCLTLNEPGSFYRPTMGPVTYVGNSGNKHTTVENVRIAPVYVILLEKTGDDWGSVSSGRLQHHGLPAPLTRNDKYASPARLQAVRGTGEAEIRNVTANAGQIAAAEIMDRNGSPVTHRHMVESLLRADKPTAIENLVDRNEVPYGAARSNVIVDHQLFCAGFSFRYAEHISAEQAAVSGILNQNVVIQEDDIDFEKD